MTLEDLAGSDFIRSTAIAMASPMAVPVSRMIPMCIRPMPFSTQSLFTVSGLSR